MTDDTDKTLVGNTSREETPDVRKIGHYEVVAELGRGGMGTVYRAYESSLNRYVAIKELAPHLADDEELVARFAREAKSVAALNHPNIVHIYYTGDDDGLPYFVMECIDGNTIAELLVANGVFSPQASVKMILQAAKGLAAAHERGIIHRDIKPSNLMVDNDGTLKIADFGIALARGFGDNLTTTGQFVGTTGYVSPEVFKGHTVDARSDIFSLGVVLFEMLAGRKLFDDNSPMGQMQQVVELPAPDIHSLNPEVDDTLRNIMERMIAKKPAERYQNCTELTDDLRHFLANEPLDDSTAPASSTPTQTAQPRKHGWVALPLLLLAVGVAGYWWRAPLADIFTNTEAAITSAPNPSDAPDGTTDTTIKSRAQNELKDSTVANQVTTNLGTTPESAASSIIANADTATTDSVNKAAINKPASLTAVNSEKFSSQNTQQNAPQALPPTATVIIVKGDPTIAIELKQMLNNATRAYDVAVIDGAFISGLSRPENEYLPAVTDIRDKVMAAGGRFLIMAKTVSLGAQALDYYGQQDTLYTSQLSLSAYDLLERTQLGSWGESVSYTNLNTEVKTREVANEMVDELVHSIVNTQQ